MPWKHGESGNPSGRPPLTPEQRAAIEKAKKLTTWSIGQLADLAEIQRDDKGRIVNGFLALHAHMAILKIGGVLSETSDAKIAEAVEARLRQLITEAEAEREREPKMLEPAQGTPAADT